MGDSCPEDHCNISGLASVLLWFICKYVCFQKIDGKKTQLILNYTFLRIKLQISPGWCGSVDWAPAYESKGPQFGFQSGHMPGLQARSPEAGHARGNHTLMFLSLSPSLPFSLKQTNKQTNFGSYLWTGWRLLELFEITEFSPRPYHPERARSRLK